jgi:spermidine dehydrogenase
VIPLYQSRTHGEWGVGIDAVSVFDVWPFGFPGFRGLKLDPGSAPDMGYTPGGYADGGSYKFHFPDGNASIARLLVRSLCTNRYLI